MALVYVVSAAMVCDAFLRRWELGYAQPAATFDRVLAGAAHRPYADRVLVPWLVGAITDAVPARLLTALEQPRGASRASLLDRVHQRYARTPVAPLPFAVACLLVFAAALLVPFVWRRLLRTAGGQPAPLADWFPALALLLVPLTFSRGGYPYDAFDLLLVSLAFLLFAERRFAAYYPVLAVAALNKETALLLLAWPLARWWVERDRRALARHLSAHLLVVLPVLVAVRVAHRHLRGAVVELHLWENLRFFLDPRSWFQASDVLAAGVPIPQGLNLLNVALFVFLVAYAWRERPPLERALFGASVLAVLPLFLAFGYRDEIRVFTPAVPSGLLLAAASVARLYRRPG